MNRLVRDLARKAGKEIELVLVGAETELDRNVVEAVSDPLVHMVRNAADHGIETPEERIKAGKPRAGKLELKAFHQAGNIVIEIHDDGKGLNKAKILKKAREAGIVTDGQELSDAEIFRLIFHAGLSTAEKITDVSGRGVGMDVVRKNVESLRGRIEISSTKGRGSTFTIRLPLTLAVIDGMVVKVGLEKFILPITNIEQSLQPRPDQLSTVHSRGEVCLIREQLLPMIRLHRLFGIKSHVEDPTKALVVIVQDNERRCCLLVDELLGQQQIVIKSLGKLLGQVPGISGGAIMGDGNVSLILDVPGLLDLARKTN
jgi:two-component system chemotaxis sensor kinase CheA